MHPKARMMAFPLLIAGSAALAAAPRDPRLHAADLLPKSGALQQHRLVQSAAGPLISNADVGDADSFGRNVTYAGLAQTGQVILQEDCSIVTGLGPDDRCVTVNAQPASTSFSFNDLGRMTLPARSTNDLLCFHSTTFQTWQFFNETGSASQAAIRYTESITIENPLLDDPSLMDPTTGLPFNGSLTVGIGTSLLDLETMQPGDDKVRNENVTRTCLGGAISKRALSEDYGLPDSVVKQFFKQPMTIRLNVSGRASLVVDSSLLFGVRMYGD